MWDIVVSCMNFHVVTSWWGDFNYWSYNQYPKFYLRRQQLQDLFYYPIESEIVLLNSNAYNEIVEVSIGEFVV